MGEGEFEAKGGGEGFEDAAAGGDDFAAYAVAGDEAWLTLKLERAIEIVEGGRAQLSVWSSRNVPILSVRAAIVDVGSWQMDNG